MPLDLANCFTKNLKYKLPLALVRTYLSNKTYDDNVLLLQAKTISLQLKPIPV